MMKSLIRFTFYTRMTKIFVFSLLGVSLMFASMGCDRTEEMNTDDVVNTESSKTSVYEQLSSELGYPTVDRLVNELGEGELDYLGQGIGASNIITLVNGIADMDKLIALVGDNYAEPATGLGVIRVVNLINGIEYWMTQPRYDGQVRDEDTLAVIIALVNSLDLSDVTNKIVALINNLGITRYMTDPGDAARLDKLTKLMAHIQNIDKIIALLQDLSVSDASVKLSDILTGLTDTEPLVEILDSITVISKMVSLVSSDNNVDASIIIDAVNALDPGCPAKFAYVLNSVDLPGTDEFNFLLELLKGVSDVTNVTQLINELEDGTTWTDQVGGAQIWDTVANAPFSADSGMVRLVNIVQGLAGGSAGYVANVEKLIVTINNLDDITKMMRLIQDLIDANDLITLLNSIADPGVDMIPITNLSELLLLVDLDVIPQFKQLVDGQRLPDNTGDQSVYLAKLYELIASLDPANDGPEKIVELINLISTPDKMVDLVMNVDTIDNLVNIVENIDISSPGTTSARTLVYLLENLSDPSKLWALVNDVTTIDNIYALINGVAAGSQLNDLGEEDLDAAGEKLLYIMDNIDDIENLTFILSEMVSIDNMITVVNTCSVASASKIAELINDVSGSNPLTDNYWDAGDTGNAAYMGKIVNLMENIDDSILLADVIDGITDINKLSKLVDNVDNSDYLVSLLNEIDVEPNTDADDLVGLINLISYTEGADDDDVSKLIDIVTTLSGSRYDLVAQLLTPYNGSDWGLGYEDMASLISDLTIDTGTGVNKAEELGELLLGVFDTIVYNETPISRREALIRLISSGVTYSGVVFPGLGTEHIVQNMINPADDINDLINLVNSLDMADLVTIIGCGDSVGDPGDDGIGPFEPDFHTPCTAVGMGW